MPTMILRAIQPSFSPAALLLLITRPSTLNTKTSSKPFVTRTRLNLVSAPTLPLPPPIFDTPVEAFGVGVKKVQKVIMDERHVLMNADIFRRVIELPYDDPRRKAPLEILYNEFATNLLTGLPVQGVLFKPAKWKEQVSVYMGLPPPETRKSVNQHMIIKGVIRGKVDLHANNLLNSHYATGGGTSLNHNTILGNVEVGLHDAGVPFKSTGSTNGQGTKGTFQGQLPENPSGSSLEKTNKIIPDLVIRASHLSGSNVVDCDLDGANHIVDFKTTRPFTIRQHLYYSWGNSGEKAKSCQQRVPRSYKEARLGAARHAARSERPNRERTQ